MNTTAAPLTERLSHFFDELGQIRQSAATTSLSAWLPEFFTRYASCRSKLAAPAQKPSAISASELGAFLTSLASPLSTARQGAFHFDPWEVAGLDRDEVRNVGVLAWLLNPQGSHGMGCAAIKGLLTTVNRHFRAISSADFVEEPGQFCRVRTEINPNGEIADRVDIEIDAENFYLIIEAKIDAPEQAGQLERYCRQAEARAGQRQWLVIFLTPEGRKPNSAGQYENSGKILPLSWRRLAAELEKSITSPAAVSSTRIAFPRLAAEFSARCFLKKIRLF